MEKRRLMMIIICILIFSSVIPLTVFAGNNTKTTSADITSEKNAVENEESMDIEDTEEDRNNAGSRSDNHSEEEDKDLGTKDDGKETDVAAAAVDAVTRKMVEEFVEGEEEHAAWVAKHLSIIEKLGYDNYLLEMMDI